MLRASLVTFFVDGSRRRCGVIVVQKRLLKPNQATASSFTMSSNMMEGLGGPIHMDRPDLGEIDPTLAACCRREVCNVKCRNVVCLYPPKLTCNSL